MKLSHNSKTNVSESESGDQSLSSSRSVNNCDKSVRVVLVVSSFLLRDARSASAVLLSSVRPSVRP